MSLYRLLPHRLVTWAFLFFTTVQLYWLAIKYLLVELHRKLSRRLGHLNNFDDHLGIPEHLPNGYVALVTGGNRGIGLSVATELYRKGATVVVTTYGLNEAERDELAEQIRLSKKSQKENCGIKDKEPEILIYEIDHRDLSSVVRFADFFNSRFPRLHLLVNNAGVMYVPTLSYTEDGFETHYQVNYLAHVLLTWLLLPALGRTGFGGDSSRASRIVNVSSSTHYARDLFLKDLQSRVSPYSPYHAYAQSKLAILMYTYWMDDWLRQLAQQEPNHGLNILVNALHPGVVNTDLYENVWWVRRFPLSARLLFRSPEDGAQTVLYAALSREVVSGGAYFEDCRKVRSSRFSYRLSIQRRLAEATASQLNPLIEKVNRERKCSQVPLMFTPPSLVLPK